MGKQVVLTGIKPTGMPHLGNYLGAIAPAILKADEAKYSARFFIADYHSINTVRDGDVLQSYIYEVAATWLAAGLDPQRMLLYKQSDIPQTFELATLLNAFTAKGLMNRAHAYKACVDKNRDKKLPDDHQINMGLYTYPILMAADILLFDTNFVPVGKDQVQHVEMAQDIAQAFNHNYGKELLVIPQAITNQDMMTIPGLDGRKMSKSHDNHIPLFLESGKLRKLIMKIVTNSLGLEEPKNPENCTIFALYRLLANDEEQTELAKRYRAGGMGWGEAKQILFEKINETISPMRDEYQRLMQNKSEIRDVLVDGAKNAFVIAQATMDRLREAVGVRL